MIKLNLTFCIFLLFIGNASFAQNRLSVSKRSPIYMDLTPTNYAGHSKIVVTDDSQWLNYTALVNSSDPTLSITIQVTSGSIPEGMELQIEARPYVGLSRGRQGTPTGKISVTHRPRVLINNISTCYTGSNRNEGHQLFFKFIITDFAKIRSGTSTIFVQYTITQN